jgi:SOS-response transcriptional repressor LexA
VKLGDRIHELREAKGLTGTQLGKLAIDPANGKGVGRGAVSDWERHESRPDNARLPAIATALGVTVDYLLSGHNTPHISESNIPHTGNIPASEIVRRIPAAGMVPLITWDQAAQWSGKVDMSQVSEWIPCHLAHGPNAYYLEIVGDSMFDPSDARSFKEGHLIGIDPDRAAGHRSFVVVQDGDEAPILRQLLIEGDSRTLKALNPEWPNRFAAMRADHRILGVVFYRMEKGLPY